LGTPVTITMDGFWDGYHNGNQPVIVVPNGQGENKKYHVPHGALVQTKPEEVEAVEFTVDKTPKPQPTYDFGSMPVSNVDGYAIGGCTIRLTTEPKLRVFRDNYTFVASYDFTERLRDKLTEALEQEEAPNDADD